MKDKDGSLSRNGQNPSYYLKSTPPFPKPFDDTQYGDRLVDAKKNMRISNTNKIAGLGEKEKNSSRENQTQKDDPRLTPQRRSLTFQKQQTKMKQRNRCCELT